MDIEHFQLPVWILADKGGREMMNERDGKRFVPVCDDATAAAVFLEQNKWLAGTVAAKPVSSLAHLLRVLIGSRDSGCKFLGRVAPSGSMKLLPIEAAIDAVQGSKSN